MRLFVALFPPEDVRDELRRHLRDAMTRPVRLTAVERWHITMAFLGENPDEELPEISQAVGAAAAGGGPIRLRLAGGGNFGTALWAGVDGDLPALFRLRARLPLGNGPFTPHLTVSYRDHAEVRAALNAYAGPPWTASELVLVHSRHAEGLGYDRVSAWPLQPDPCDGRVAQA
ncbi:RNA 2',3'-cyclic phosphodiesterase [Actinoplanes sp. NPDC089786]|uniref:RNA 2',3'-cyclic phosphodiesterase n=1 Tax=Actinoplanes sp. NPDC089786 TaxID=3155185 RepID=UPI003434CA53